MENTEIYGYGLLGLDLRSCIRLAFVEGLETLILASSTMC